MDIAITDGVSTRYVSEFTYQLLSERKKNKWQRINNQSPPGEITEFLNRRSDEQKALKEKVKPKGLKGIKQREPTDIPLSISKIKENLVNYSKKQLLADSRKGVRSLAELK